MDGADTVSYTHLDVYKRQIYNRMKEPDWGPSLEGLDMEHIVTYVRPNTHMSGKWSDVPEEIKNTFELLGIPQAEQRCV